MNRLRLIKLSYFVFTALLAASIPVSRYMISVFQFCLAGIFILEGIRYESVLKFYKNKLITIVLAFLPFHLWLVADAVVRQIRRVAANRLLLVFLLFSLVLVSGMIYTDDVRNGLKDLRNMLPVFLLPLFFTAIGSFEKQQKYNVLLFFALSATVNSFISFSIFLGGEYDDIRRISPYVSHIHLSLFVDYAIFILFYFYKTGITPRSLKVPALLLILWLFVFQVFILKSLTGVGVLVLGIYFMVLLQHRFGFRLHQALRLIVLIVLPASLLILVILFTSRFYKVDPIDPDQLEHYTAKGNPYHHNLNERMLENGHYVYIYISEEELREEWEKVSSYNYDSLDNKGQYLKYTLIRYLTSRGLRKDAAGMNQLDAADIKLVESGMANHIFADKYSLYPRFYQVIWELDVYFKTGNPTGHSVTQRLESLKMGLQIATKHPLFGTGTGALDKAYHKQYELSGSKLEKDFRIVGANQFLNMIAGFGILGFAVMLFAWLYPAVKRNAFRNPLYLMFFFIAVTAMFSEEILRFQTGITFFAFFYSFFIFIEPDH